MVSTRTSGALDGRAEGAGTEAAPWDLASVLAGSQLVAAGDTIWVRGGTYKHPDRRPGTNGYPVKLVGAEGKPIPISHPNARATLSNAAIGNYNEPVAEDPAGAPVKVITYSGRDSNTMPPIWVAKNPNHGVAIGASIVSAATATEVGATGVKRQPWANAPFIPGALADYMKAQFTFFNSGKLTDKSHARLDDVLTKIGKYYDDLVGTGEEE